MTGTMRTSGNHSSSCQRYREVKHLSHLNRSLIKSPLKLAAAVHKNLNQRTAGRRLILFPIKQVLLQRWPPSKSKSSSLNIHNRQTHTQAHKLEGDGACEIIHIQNESRPETHQCVSPVTINAQTKKNIVCVLPECDGSIRKGENS